MLRLLHKKHIGKSVSIVGSGPSADLFNSSTDISIGVNGAAYLGKKFDYFLCGDNNSHRYKWFREKCSDVRVISKLVASLDYQLYPKEFDQVVRRLSVPQHKQKMVKDLLCPVYPHITFEYRWFKPGRLSATQNFLMFGGTISGCAAQLAFLMGCSEIHLYGCNFTHKRQHYFYDNEERPGRVVDSQRDRMDKCLKDIRDLGVKVYMHGPSKLTQFDKRVE